MTRGGNRHMSWRSCTKCGHRLIEIPTISGQTIYYQVPACTGKRNLFDLPCVPRTRTPPSSADGQRFLNYKNETKSQTECVAVWKQMKAAVDMDEMPEFLLLKEEFNEAQRRMLMDYNVSEYQEGSANNLSKITWNEGGLLQYLSGMRAT